MKNLKKVLALVIALTMVLSTVAFASYADVDADADYAGAVELLSALNVLKGDENGNFNPDNTITRAEFAAVVCRCLGLESSANSAAGVTAFSDVAADHWASGYINLATQNGVINGRGNGIFDPNGNVTFAEAVKMLVVAMGYEPMAAQKGGYPTGYLTVANGTKMTAGVAAAGGASAPALRSTVAQLAANALEIPKMDQVGFGSDTSFEVFDDYDTYATLLTAMDVFKLTGLVTAIDKVKGEVTVEYTQGSDDYEFGYTNKGDLKNDTNNNGVIDGAETKLTETFKVGASNVADYVQKNADVYVKKLAKRDYEVLFVVAAEVGETLVINGEDLDPANATVDGTARTLQYKETKDATKYTKFDVKANPNVYINGQAATYTTLNLSAYATKIEFVETTDDDVFDVINITIYEHGIVEEVDAAKEKITFADANSVRFDSEDKDQIVDIFDAEGNAIALEDIKEGDVLAMVVHSINGLNAVRAKNFATATANNQITIYNLGANTVTGVITESDDAESLVYIDGTEYEVAATFADSNRTDVIDISGNAKLGTEGTFFLNIAGDIIGFDGTAGGNANYAYVLQAEYNTGDAFSAGWQVKMITADGIATYDLYKNVSINGGANVASNTLVAGDAFFSAFSGATAWNTTPQNNVVEYKLATDGTIKAISVVTANYANVAATSAFNANTNKLSNRLLADDVLIFDLTVTDADDVKITDIATLVDDGVYGGEVFDNADGDGYKVFVMTSGTAAFDAEAKVNVVESVRKTTYDGDDSAVIVKYYTDGIADELSLIFTTDSANKNATNAYATLKKGDLFVANADAEGVVSDYVVLATVNETTKTFDVVAGAFAAAYGPEYKADATYTTGKLDDGVAYLVTYFKEVKNGVAYFEDNTATDDYGFRISAGAAAYNYTKTNTTRVLEAGDYLGTNVDNAANYDTNNDGTDDAYLGANVLIKLYDGEVIDIISYNEMVSQSFFN